MPRSHHRPDLFARAEAGMNTTLVRRLQKLEERFGPSGDDPTSERRRRLAEGLCPDCGLDHPTLPSRGGPWRCSVCGRPFVLQPGPACTQTCPVEGGRGCNARQLGRRRQEQHPEAQRRLDERHARQATEDLTASMAPAHRAILEGWLQARLAEDEPVARPGERVFELLARLEPPALVRAWWALISHHVETNASV